MEAGQGWDGGPNRRLTDEMGGRRERNTASLSGCGPENGNPYLHMMKIDATVHLVFTCVVCTQLHAFAHLIQYLAHGYTHINCQVSPDANMRCVSTCLYTEIHSKMKNRVCVSVYQLVPLLDYKFLEVGDYAAFTALSPGPRSKYLLKE